VNPERPLWGGQSWPQPLLAGTSGNAGVGEALPPRTLRRVSKKNEFAASLNSGYGDDMTVEAIKEEIGHLSEPERKQLLDWLEEQEEEAWDREIERDFAPGGRGERLMAEVEADIAAGRTRPLADVLAEAKARRDQPR